MANYLSKVKLGDTTYLLKDSEVRSAVEALQTAIASSLVFKGTVSNAAGITGLTNYKTGWTYKASASFSISGLGEIENGDMIICISNYSNSYKVSDWTVVQNNVDVMTGATSTTSGVRGLVPEPTKNDVEKFLCGDGTWKASSNVIWGSFAELI